jgi:hypothetical protein
VTGGAYERFRRDYAPAFLQYLSERGEQGRRAAYELGRRAISEQLSVLDLARIHHGMLLEVLKTHRSSQELEHIAQAASEFLVEALAVFEMTQRGYTELASTDTSVRPAAAIGGRPAPIRTIVPTPDLDSPHDHQCTPGHQVDHVHEGT